MGLLLGLGALLSASCGSSSGDSSSGGGGSCGQLGTGGGGPVPADAGTGTALCDPYCARMCAATPDQCLKNCSDEHAQFGASCASQLDALDVCVAYKASISCDHGIATAHGCDTEQSAVMACEACVATPTDPPCMACKRQNCCNELQAYYGDPNWLTQVHCSAGSCATGCKTSYPTVTANQAAIDACASQHCASSC